LFAKAELVAVASNDGASTVAMRFQIAPKSSFSSEDGQIKFLPFSGPASYFSLPSTIDAG
jgi:hypothetical protein